MMALGTVKLHRILKTTPEKLYRAFLDPHAIVKWLPPNGYTCTVDQLDPKVGGSYRMTFTNFTTEDSHSFGGEYLELIPGKRLRYTDKFENPQWKGDMITTIDIQTVSLWTEINIVQEGIPEQIPTAMCYLGWQESLVLLAKLVEPNITV